MPSSPAQDPGRTSLVDGLHFSVLYSLVQTAERHHVNALDYLEDVLMRVQVHPASRIDELLPHRWKPPDGQAPSTTVTAPPPSRSWAWA